jgi:DnaJ-domain-containing protein 1
MDRRDNPETSGNLTDEQFRTALEIILGSYSGASADRLYRDAIHCFDSLIEISHNTDAIRDFARRHNTDHKYLVDGANFVISMMHFNTENNYYVTLGLSRNATPAEIRERWKKLMLLYHPDRQPGNEEWVSERAKKVNEAYSILREDEKRQAFDRKLLKQVMTQKPSRQMPSKDRMARPGFRSSRNADASEWGRKKKYMPRIIVGTYILSALIFLGYIYLHNNAVPLESALFMKEDLETTVHPEPGASHEDKNAGSIKPAHSPGSEEKGTPGREVMTEPGDAGNRQVRDPSGKANGPAAAAERKKGKLPAREDAASKNAETPLPLQTTSLAADPRNVPQVPQVKDIPAAGPGTEKHAPALPAVQETAASAQQVQDRKTSGITREEVQEFMKRYANAYSRGDINAFMSLFSRSVVENSTLHYNEIRDAYRNTFSEKINFYRVDNITIVIYGQTARVTGVYDLSRYASFEDRWMRSSGSILWEIIKEKNELKIVTMNYDK